MANPWKLYNTAKNKIGNSTIDLDAGVFYMALFQSASNASTATLSTYNSVTSEVTGTNGYTTGGKALGAVTWGVGQNASAYKFDASDEFWSANGGTISNISLAVIYQSIGTSKHLLAWSRLTTAQLSLADTNRLTIQLDATLGIFELS